MRVTCSASRFKSGAAGVAADDEGTNNSAPPAPGVAVSGARAGEDAEPVAVSAPDRINPASRPPPRDGLGLALAGSCAMVRHINVSGVNVAAAEISAVRAIPRSRTAGCRGCTADVSSACAARTPGMRANVSGPAARCTRPAAGGGALTTTAVPGPTADARAASNPSVLVSFPGCASDRIARARCKAVSSPPASDVRCESSVVRGRNSPCRGNTGLLIDAVSDPRAMVDGWSTLP